MDRYTINGEEGDILTNLQGLTNQEIIYHAEFEGFLTAEIMFTEHLTPTTKFTVKYICDIHRTALKELYSFAGHFRSVNLSKGGFVFPAGRFIPDNMRIFEEEMLSTLPDRYPDRQSLIRDMAKVHGELLFIHPFREGNGRTARILANLMARKQGYTGLNFKRVNFNDYIIAVQQVARRDYSFMERIITNAFQASSRPAPK